MRNADVARRSAISTFTEIAREHHKKFLTLDAQIRELKEALILSRTDNDTENEFEIMKLERETIKYVAIVIVFSAIAVEAYIYDYAARNLTDTFVKNHLDKLDPISKWVIIPRLVTGNELPRERRWFQLLNKLIQQRNKIVHDKSSSLPAKYFDAIEYFKKAQQHTALIYDTAREATELLDLLVDEMESLDPSEIGWVDGYLAPNSDNLFRLMEEL